MLTFIRYIAVNFTLALLDCVCYNTEFVKLRMTLNGVSAPYIFLYFGQAEENHSLYQGLRLL